MTTTSRFSFKRIADPANRMGLVGAALVLATLVFGAYEIVPIIRAIRAGGATTEAADGQDAVVQYAAAIKNNAGQINGRSFFFDPPPPPPPYTPPPPPPPVDNRPPPPPPPPSTYGGPQVVGTAMDTVWFANNKTMRVGGPLEDDMRVISISTAPYVVKIEWKKVQFDVPFLPRDRVIDKSRPGADSTPEPEPTPPPPSPSAPASKPGEPGASPPGAAPPAPGEPKPDANPDEKKPEKKDEPKPANDAPAGTTPPPPPDKKDGTS
jgi:hypothetical protein